MDNLQAHVDEWVLMRDEVAPEMHDRNLLPMFFDILPKDYSEQLQEDPSIQSLNDAIARVTAKCRRLNQARLAHVQQAKREAAVKAGSTASFVHAATPADAVPPAQPAAMQPTVDTMAMMAKTIAETVSAALKQDAPRGRDQRRDRNTRRDRSESPNLWKLVRV